MNPKFWKGKKVLITGHTGFKGSWLVLILHHLGAKITGYALNPISKPNFFDNLNLSKIFKTETSIILLSVILFLSLTIFNYKYLYLAREKIFDKFKNESKNQIIIGNVILALYITSSFLAVFYFAPQ